jgi:hypothetical protein
MRLICESLPFVIPHQANNNGRPTTFVDENGTEHSAVEPWVWFLISRPILTHNPDEESLRISENIRVGSIFPPWYRTPPNFPRQIITSWVVFAAPKAHVGIHPGTDEGFTVTPPQSHIYDFATTSTKRCHKRLDFDFSNAGIPIFEFSSPGIISNGPSHPRIEFLSIDGMGSWSKDDEFQKYTLDEYRKQYALWQDRKLHLTRSGKNIYQGIGDGKGPMPPSSRGVWWKAFYGHMHDECNKWKGIKAAMGRGKCRIVVRWDEVEEMQDQLKPTSSGDRSLVLRGARKGLRPARLKGDFAPKRSALGLLEEPSHEKPEMMGLGSNSSGRGADGAGGDAGQGQEMGSG